MKSPPHLSIEEIINKNDSDLIEEINQSGAGIIFVALGCPKQEIWMSHHQGSIKGVMVGVGAVFSMYAGINRRAPHWIQQAGLEWLYRLLQEPRRLWWRYGSTIPSFLYLAIKQLVIPYKIKLSKARWSKTPKNVAVDVDTLNLSCEKLGEILVRQNELDRKKLEKALLEQESKPDLKLGEILVRQNSISLSQLKFYLRNQQIKIGELLVERKILNQRSLNKALALQKNRHQRIGEILLEQKIISEDDLNVVLTELYTRRKGLFLTDDITFTKEFNPNTNLININEYQKDIA